MEWPCWQKICVGTKTWHPSPKLTLLLLPPYLSTIETDVEPWIMHDSLRRPSSHSLVLSYIGPLPPWKGQQFIFTKTYILSVGLLFLPVLTWSHLYSGAHRYGIFRMLSLQIKDPIYERSGSAVGYMPVWFTSSANFHFIH